MIHLLTKLFIKKEEDAEKVRQTYGILCGITGICLNVILFAGKFLAGSLSHSIAITADAFNNLSDGASSVITLLGFRLAGSKPDPEHPFGHGRIEYVSGLVVAASILVMAFELVKNSIQKILHPEEVAFSGLILIILLVSIGVKIYMFCYNNTIGKKVNSAAMRATALDSLSDSVATSVVFLSTLVGHYTGWKIDGYCGVLVGIFIFWAGISAAKETLNPLLGQPPEEAYVKEIEDIVMSRDVVSGIHDLIVHDYGPGRRMITLHAEVPAEGDILRIHDEIDLIEKELNEKLGCLATIHMDPVVTEDAQVERLKSQTISIIKELDEKLSIHDFRMVSGPSHTNLIFDLAIPYKFFLKDSEVVKKVQNLIKKEMGDHYFAVIDIDHVYL